MGKQYAGVEYYDTFKINDGMDLANLTEEEIRVLDACIWMVRNGSTIRKTAKEFGYSKSTLHRRIHHECRLTSYDLYGWVCSQLNVNMMKKGMVRNG